MIEIQQEINIAVKFGSDTVGMVPLIPLDKEAGHVQGLVLTDITGKDQDEWKSTDFQEVLATLENPILLEFDNAESMGKLIGMLEDLKENLFGDEDAWLDDPERALNGTKYEGEFIHEKTVIAEAQANIQEMVEKHREEHEEWEASND